MIITTANIFAVGSCVSLGQLESGCISTVLCTAAVSPNGASP